MRHKVLIHALLLMNSGATRKQLNYNSYNSIRARILDALVAESICEMV